MIALIAEHTKAVPSKHNIKTLMDKTLSKRRQWIMEECPRVDGIFKCFPPLSQNFKNVSALAIMWT